MWVINMNFCNQLSKMEVIKFIMIRMEGLISLL